MSPQDPAIDPRRTALLIMDYQPASSRRPRRRWLSSSLVSRR
jgi:hypothetical protein